MSILINILLGFNVIVSLLIILLVLMQRPKSEGLGAAFGGGMTENLFGAQTTNVLANATRWLGGIFFVLTLVLSILYSQQSKYKSSISQQLANAPKPVVTATPALTGSAAQKAAILEELKQKMQEAAPTASPEAAAPAATSAEPAATATPTPAASATPTPKASATPAAKATPKK